MYSPETLDHFQNPRNPGEIEDPEVVVQIENPACGDVLRLSARTNGQAIVDIRFRAKGCVPAMACASALTELVLGLTLGQAEDVRREDLLGRVGALPEASEHATHLAMDALHVLLKQLKAR